METQDYLVLLAAFFLAAATGFAVSEAAQSDGFARDVDVRVDNENDKQTIEFDNKTLELRHENFEEAKFYYGFNDTRGVQQIEGLKHNGEVQNLRDIRSFGEDTYFLYIRYQDNSSEFGDAWMKLYRIEKT